MEMMKKRLAFAAVQWSLAACVVVAPVWAFGLPAAYTAVAESHLDGKATLQLTLPVGRLTQLLPLKNGNGIRLNLKQVERAELDNMVRQLLANPALVKSARADVLPNQEAVLWLEFSPSVQLVHQVLSTPATGLSRWDLQLQPQAPVNTPTAVAVPVELRELRLAARDDLLDIHLSGSAELAAEVSVLDQPGRLVVEFPGASMASVEWLASQFKAPAVPLFARVSAAQQGGVPRLEFSFHEDIDLVDSLGEVRDGKGLIRISLAADRAVAQARLGAGGAAGDLQLRSIDAKLTGRAIELSLPGVPVSRLQSYALDEPPRLVVDLLGWRPDQVRDAATRFVSPHASIGALRVESSRLGSARLVFDLTAAAPLLSRGAADVDRYALALRLPGVAAPAFDAGKARPATSFARRDERLDPKAPLVVVRPLLLVPPEQRAPSAEDNNGLSRLYNAALDRDPKYLSAKADFEIAQQAVPQARAALLPTASIDYQKSYLRQDIQQASNITFPTGVTRYPSANLSLTITQPLLRLPAVIKHSQAGLSIDQSRFNLLAAEQELILRVASAYLNVLAGTDGVDLAQAERDSTERQFELAKARKSTGLGNVPQLFEAEARFAQARAREREARNRLEDARLALKEIVGEDPGELRGFKGDFAPTEPMPAEVGPWVDAAAEQNLALQARRLSVEIAGLEIRRQQAGYAPSINLVASTANQDTGGSLFGRGQRYNNTEVGVRVNVPLFEGGMTKSLVREAVARKEKALNEQEQELRRSDRLARTAFNGVLASVDSVEALRKAVLAQQSALEAREEGLKSGLFSPIQLMDANRLYFTAKREFLQARYDYLLNRLKLKQAVGVLSRNDLDDLGALLQIQ
ncbi:MAG: TolC family outer membrane protein [Roseateles sp.]